MACRILHVLTGEYLRYPDNNDVVFDSREAAETFISSGQASGFAMALEWIPLNAPVTVLEFEVICN
jgi:hypothetical protein